MDRSNDNNGGGGTALHAAQAEGNTRLLSALTDRADKQTKNARNRFGQTVFHVAVNTAAADNSNEVNVEWFLRHGFDARALDNAGHAPIHCAVLHGLDSAVEAFLAADPSLVELPTGRGETPLWLAARLGRARVVAVLLERNADANARHSASGASALWVAVFMEREAVVRLLLKRGAAVDATDRALDGTTPFVVALARGHRRIVRMLVSSGQFVEADNGWGVVKMVVLMKRLDVLDLVQGILHINVGHLAATHRDTADGNSLLHYAVMTDCEATVRAVLSFCRLLSANRDGDTPLDLAQKRQCRAVVSALYEESSFGMGRLAAALGVKKDRGGTSPVLHHAESHHLLLQVPSTVSSSTKSSPVGSPAMLRRFSNRFGRALGLGGSSRENSPDKSTEDLTMLRARSVSPGPEMVHRSMEDLCDASDHSPKLRRRLVHVLGLSKSHLDMSMAELSHSFPLASPIAQHLREDLREENGDFFRLEPNESDDLAVEDLLKYVLPRFDLPWACVGRQGRCLVDNVPALSEVDLFSSGPKEDDPNTHVVRSVMLFVQRVEKHVREKDPVFKHLDVAFVAVGSVPEATRVGTPSELEVRVFCRDLFDQLYFSNTNGGEDAAPALRLDHDAYSKLHGDIRQLFHPHSRELNLHKFFVAFVEAVGGAVDHVVPDAFEIHLERGFRPTSSCDASCADDAMTFGLSRQCRHALPPVTFSKTGAAINLVWRGEVFHNLVIVIELVPLLHVTCSSNPLNGDSSGDDSPEPEAGVSSLEHLRERVARHVISHRPVGWSGFMEQHLSQDRLHLGRYDPQEELRRQRGRGGLGGVRGAESTFVGLEMLSPRGGFVLRSPAESLTTHSFEGKCEPVRLAYCLLKMLRHVAGVSCAQLRSAVIKRVMLETLSSSCTPPTDSGVDQLCAFVRRVLRCEDLLGHLERGVHPVLRDRYACLDLADFPKDGRFLHLLSVDALALRGAIVDRRDDDVELLIDRMGRGKVTSFRMGGYGALHLAARYGTATALRALVSAGCDANSKDARGRTPLHRLAEVNSRNKQRSLDAVFKAMILLSEKQESLPDVNAVDCMGRTAAHVASEDDSNCKLVEFLVSKGVDVNVCDKSESTALEVAVENECVGIVKLLLRNGADANHVGHAKRTPLHLIVRERAEKNDDDDHHRAEEICRLLLTHGAAVDAVGDSHRSTPLFEASRSGFVGLCQLLLGHGADANWQREADGVTPLLVASQKGHADVVAALTARGADVNKCSVDGRSPLEVASTYGRLSVVRQLVQRGADVNHANGNLNGVTPLLSACQHSHSGVVRHLLDHGADANRALRSNGMTPLMVAALNGKPDLIETLLLRGDVDVSAKRRDGSTALGLACHAGHVGVARMLLEGGAEPNPPLRRGEESPLSTACRNGDRDIVRLLLKHGAVPAVDMAGVVKADVAQIIDEHLLAAKSKMKKHVPK